MEYYLAIDIGASSGRHLVGHLEKNKKLIVEEIYRFPNSVKKLGDHLTWDIEELFKNVKIGIKKTLEKYKHIESMSIDTWGVDYVLFNKDKEIWPNYAYRDKRTEEIIDEVHKIIPFERLYEITGCQFQKFNTIYQLYWDLKNHVLEDATDMLLIPEYLMYRLTGNKVREYTNASTMGLLDLKTNDYSDEIIDKLGFDRRLFKELHKPGTVVGDFTDEVKKEVGGNIKVVLCSTHDTASAVEGIEMEGNHPYISSGTWSLLGVKHKTGVNSKEAYKANYSNEYGPHYIRLQKNIMGLWIIQGLAKQMKLDFPTMVEMSMKSTFTEIFDVNDDRFLSSLDMKNEIKNWYLDHEKEAPVEDKDVINAAYVSLAYSYKVALDELEKITGKTYEKLYIVGGGAKNKYLNMLTEKYVGKTVVALPIEATAIGNILDQIKEK